MYDDSHRPSVYDLLDRPVSDLPRTERALLLAMRRWVHALTLDGDPAAATVQALGDAPEAVAPFDAAMRALDRGSTDAITFQRPCHAGVDDMEAVLLAIWRQVGCGAGATARATLRRLVDAPAADAVATAMARVATLLARAPAARG